MLQQAAAIVARIVAILLYALVIVISFALACGWPVLMLSFIIEHRRTRNRAIPILICTLVGAGFVAGGLLGWSFRPREWKMPFWETIYASVSASEYGHELESQAERVFLFYFLYAGVFGSVAAGTAAAMIAKSRTLTGHPPAGEGSSGDQSEIRGHS